MNATGRLFRRDGKLNPVGALPGGDFNTALPAMFEVHLIAPTGHNNASLLNFGTGTVTVGASGIVCAWNGLSVTLAPGRCPRQLTRYTLGVRPDFGAAIWVNGQQRAVTLGTVANWGNAGAPTLGAHPALRGKLKYLPEGFRR